MLDREKINLKTSRTSGYCRTTWTCVNADQVGKRRARRGVLEHYPKVGISERGCRPQRHILGARAESQRVIVELRINRLIQIECSRPCERIVRMQIDCYFSAAIRQWAFCDPAGNRSAE